MSAAADEPRSLGAPDGRTVLEVLYLRAAPHLTPAEMEHMALAEGVASELVRQVGTVAAGVASLVEADELSECSAGSFTTGREVGALLHLIAGTLSQVEGLLYVSAEAAAVRRQSNQRPKART